MSDRHPSPDGATDRLRQLAFGLPFAVGLPIGLTLWGVAAPGHFDLWTPPVWTGLVVLALGAALYLWSMGTYMARTGKLPVTIAPPAVAVTSGPYWLLNDPIYSGFCLLVLGASIVSASPFAFWFIAPSVSLATFCYSLGVEAAIRPVRATPALLGIPVPDARLARGFILTSLAGHLLLITSAFALLSSSPSALTWAGLSLAGLLALFAVVIGRGELAGGLIRSAVHSAYIAAALFLVVRYVPGASNDSLLPAAGAIGAGVALRLADRPLRALAAAAVGLAVILAFGMLASPGWTDLASLALVALLAWALPDLYRMALQLSERIANSWQARRFGPVRVINYAGFAFLAAAIGGLVFATFVGPNSVWALAIIGVLTLVAAGAWGQLLESTGRLGRPFGYFGATIGAVLGTLLAAWVTGIPVTVIGAALALAAPWIQAIGRMRCLVQGCCHGRPVPHAGSGIRCTSRHSRAVAIGGLHGVPIYPTQLFSALSNVLLAMLLPRLALSGAPAAIIVAVYAIAAGCSRFAEESFRGEPQTRIVRGLKIYQWLALLLVAGAVVMTLIPSPPMPAAAFPTLPEIATSLLLGLLYAVAMGVDFPDSRTRLSRLTPSA